MVDIAVIPIGGYGTRFLPATKAIPKEMLPVYNKPLIQHIFEEAREAGITKFIFITGRNKNVISNHFDHNFELERLLLENGKQSAKELIFNWLPEPGSIAYIRQQQSLGLGHAISCAKSFINEPFAILLPDELFIGKQNITKELINCHLANGENFIAVKQTQKELLDKYGVISYDKNNKCDFDDEDSFLLDNMVEKPPINKAPSDLTIVGRYILKPDIFKYLSKCDKGSNGEFQLTDAIAMMIKDDKHKVYAKKISSKRFDCGHALGLLKANIHFAVQDDEQKDTLRCFINSSEYDSY